MTRDNRSDNIIPSELLEQLQKGNCVLFLGTDYPMLPSGDLPPGRVAFAEKLRARIMNLVRPGMNFWEIAEAYELDCGRQALVSMLKDWGVENGRQPYPIHDVIAQLPVDTIITTAYDDRLEQALRAVEKPFEVVINDLDVPFVGADKKLILKLLGDVAQPDSLILTDDDQRNLKGRLGAILNVVRYLFVIKTLIFVGYDMTDDFFRDLYAEVTRGIRNYQRRAYAIWRDPTSLDQRCWEQKGVFLINSQPFTFLTQLHSAIRTSRQTILSAEPLKLLHRRPYKFLDYYASDDVEIFFGREVESSRLWQKILSYRLVVLFGPSGSGKTSLLNAGVLPRLVQQDYRVLYVRVHDDPSRVIQQSVLTSFSTWGIKSKELAQPVCEDLSTFFLRTFTTDDRVVIFLDQFEELFITVAPEIQQRFLAELVDCLRNNSREVRFVLSLREDFLPHLETYRDILLQHYATSFRLEPLGRMAAEMAITDPAQRVGLEYEPGLVQNILEDLLQTGSIDPPQLQIVCDRLYNQVLETTSERATSEQPRIVTKKQYSDLGGAREILAAYVDEVIIRLPQVQHDYAHDVLKAMITNEGTKALLTQAGIIARVGRNPTIVEQVIQNLVTTRLMRQIRGEQNPLYELTHEYLLVKIRTWVSQEELDAEKVRRLLAACRRETWYSISN